MSKEMSNCLLLQRHGQGDTWTFENRFSMDIKSDGGSESILHSWLITVADSVSQRC